MYNQSRSFVDSNLQNINSSLYSNSLYNNNVLSRALNQHREENDIYYGRYVDNNIGSGPKKLPVGYDYNTSLGLNNSIGNQNRSKMPGSNGDSDNFIKNLYLVSQLNNFVMSKLRQGENFQCSSRALQKIRKQRDSSFEINDRRAQNNFKMGRNNFERRNRNSFDLDNDSDKDETDVKVGSITFRPSKGDWKCSGLACQNWNYSKRDKCNICGKPKPGSQDDVDDGKQYFRTFWKCCDCKFDNFETKIQCYRCKRDRTTECEVIKK